MKNTNKVISILLTVIITLSMCMPVFGAAGDSKEEAHEGNGNLGAVYNGSITIYKYDIATWEAYMNSDDGRPQGAEDGYVIKYFPNVAIGKQLNPTDQVGYYYLNQTDQNAENNKQAVLLQDLDELSNIVFLLESVTPKADKDGSLNPDDYDIDGVVTSYGKTVNGIMKWTGVDKGYYRVTELANETTQEVVDPFIISVPMLDPTNIENPAEIKDIHIYPKNKIKDGPDVTKEITSNLENGNTVSWKITADVPNDIATAQRYVITDKMSKGLEYVNNSLIVFYGTDTQLIKNTDYDEVITPSSDGTTSLKMELKQAGMQKLAAANADTLYLTYDTAINLSDEEWEEILNGADVNNEVTLTFTNEDGHEYTKKPDPVPVDDFAGIKILKLDGVTEEKLAGVKFKIYTQVNENDVVPESVLKNKDGSDVVLTTNAQGIAYYYGLGKGTYYLVETETIGGYKLLTGYKTITITDQQVTDHEVVELTIHNFLDNTITLPQTGGMGTMLFTIGGILLLLAAGIVYVTTRKKKR